ncbi:hypothetical protein HYPSUDRAFT_146982, partial [Hypholoma sublateritium FD-334 SS-4]
PCPPSAQPACSRRRAGPLIDMRVRPTPPLRPVPCTQRPSLSLPRLDAARRPVRWRASALPLPIRRPSTSPLSFPVQPGRPFHHNATSLPLYARLSPAYAAPLRLLYANRPSLSLRRLVVRRRRSYCLLPPLPPPIRS